MSDLYYPMITVIVIPSLPKAEAKKASAELAPRIQAWLKEHGITADVKPV